VLVQPVEQPVEVSAGVAPVEADRGLLVAALEAKQALPEFAAVGEIVGVRTLRWITEK
jgi:hypothetical protein